MESMYARMALLNLVSALVRVAVWVPCPRNTSYRSHWRMRGVSQSMARNERISMSVNTLTQESFPEILFEKMKRINPAIQELELYEFRYGLNNLIPEGGWGSVTPDEKEKIE